MVPNCKRIIPLVLKTVFTSSSATRSIAATILDGFSVTGGNANQTRGPYDGGAGGGMFHSDSDAVIVNCRFVENSARHGGAVHVERGSPAFRACTFARNYGGGMGGTPLEATLALRAASFWRIEMDGVVA